MYSLKLTENYTPKLSQRETEKAIKLVKDGFQSVFSSALGLERISAPVMVRSGSGLNDDLNGVERPVRFDVPQAGFEVEIVHSLAKWKRMALSEYGFKSGEGLYTDMNAIRRDDSLDNLHSVYVDQWDWEKVIERSDRTDEFLKSTVRKIAKALADTKDIINGLYPALKEKLCPEVYFITSEELLKMYPNKTVKEREYEIVKKHRTVFVQKIGGALSDGTRHDGRAPDYDDWDKNGDLLFWHSALGEPIEISSMGIRVDAQSLLGQLTDANALDRLKYEYHKGIMSGSLPLTIGGGIGQSRLCMLLLEKLHIGEVQASIWSDETIAECKRAGIELL